MILVHLHIGVMIQEHPYSYWWPALVVVRNMGRGSGWQVGIHWYATILPRFIGVVPFHLWHLHCHEILRVSQMAFGTQRR